MGIFMFNSLDIMRRDFGVRIYCDFGQEVLWCYLREVLYKNKNELK